MATLEKVLVPLYLGHRYQVEAAAKIIGGVQYDYSVKGQANEKTSMIDPVLQEAAIEGLLKTLDPEVLTLPETIISLIPPVPVGYRRDRESFEIRTGLTFDPIGVAEAAAAGTLHLMLNPQRMSRLFEQNARNGNRISVQDYLSRIAVKVNSNIRDHQGLSRAIAEVVEMKYVEYLIRLAADESTHHQVSGAARGLIQNMQSGIGTTRSPHSLAVLSLIKQFVDDPAEFKSAQVLGLPDGSPIGCDMHF